MKESGLRVVVGACAVLAAGACSAPGGGDGGYGLTPDKHTFFPITSGVHALGTPIKEGAMACESCHPSTASSFKDVNCVACHGHEKTVTDLLHTSIGSYQYVSANCLSCHPAGEKIPFDHAGITGGCALCHNVDAQFAALPLAGFTHRDMGGNDCGACHSSFVAWDAGVSGATDSRDPANDVNVNALEPSFSGPTIQSVSPLMQLMPMAMNHASVDVPDGGFSTCNNCHLDAPAVYFPGLLHSSLANLALPAPSACKSCHTASQPRGFVGAFATSPARSPASGEMRHDAVAWSAGVPTANRLVTQDCAVCHTSPTEVAASKWTSGAGGTGTTQFHASLAGAALPQPGSCIDCHANSRPLGLLTSADAGVPAGVTFDHQSVTALDDCASCHTSSSPAFTTWRGGKFHPAGATNPTTCVPCHASERPNGTPPATASFTATPFDFATNSRNITHGAGQDCASCHPGPGSGAWGSTQNWLNGRFNHGVGTPSATTCVACHTTQRPDLLPGLNAGSAATLLGFDHSLNGSGDCFGCHQTTVTRASYGNLYNPSGNLPADGGFSGGVTYPGATFVASLTRSVSITETRLNKTGSLVTSTTASTATYFNGMSHTSAALPTELNAGPTGTPDNTKCWHCHTNDAGTVISFNDGVFHASLTNYRATPGGAIAAFPQPTTRCNDCHAQMRPSNIVMRTANDLLPMDHNAAFTASVNINGTTTNNANGLDCSNCHRTAAGTTWADGQYHARIAAAVPQDCVTCHYPLMADAAKSDLTSGTNYAMRHRSGLITSQACASCHGAALGKSTQTPAAPLWNPGAYHASVAAQPGACLDCHSVSDPVANTQSTVQYTLALGGTTTNKAQWMSHTSPVVVGKDCAVCHASDAKAAVTTFNKASVLHKVGTTTSTCKECHGGTTPGTNNNLPSGLTNSITLTVASSVANSGVPAGTYDQINHVDLNVSARDCNFCHTQAGQSSVAGIQGKEWAQGTFHVHFTAGSPLQANGTTARCSNCHLNVKPGAAYTAYNHTSLTSASGSTDCASCHSWPGTGTATAPNWKGAVGGAPVNITVGGFSVPVPPATAAGTVAPGIANLPHPSGTTCTQCHSGGAGGKNAIGYDHASTLIQSNCNSCHEAGSNLVGTVWNGSTTMSGGAGSTRPFSINNLTCSFNGTRAFNNDFDHFALIDCKECHQSPTGVVNASTGTTYTSRWKFRHSTSRMTNSGTCNKCHSSPNSFPKG